MTACLKTTAALALALVFGTTLPAPAQDVNEAVEKAMKAASEKVAPLIVKIDTSGGTETIRGGGPGRGGPPQGPGIRKGLGPTTGLIVSADGYIITSAFNFANKAMDIVVSVPGRERFVADVVSTDHTRMITLLKLKPKDAKKPISGLPVPVPFPKSEMEMGQWALALGRTLDPNLDHPPSISAGIISAKNRIWGKAIQTDAKVSPVNYGGPLTALDGRVFGVLVPASSRGEDETAGVEWYDSGIGFAIPLEDVLAALPRLKEKKNLHRGLLGVTPKPGGDMYNAPAVIGSIMPDSAASRIGLKVDDTITHIDGQPIPNYSTVMHILGPRYEGDEVEVRIKRGDKEEVFPKVRLSGISATVTAFLGVLPMRDDPGPGVEIRYVFPKSPAEIAGLKGGDRLMKIGTAATPTLAPLANRAALTAAIARLGANAEVKFEVKRKAGGKTETVTAKLVPAEATLPAILPLPSSVGKALEKPKAVPMPPVKIDPKKGPKLPEPPKKPDTSLAFQDKPKPGDFDKDEPKEKKDEKPKIETGLLKRKNEALGREYWVYVPRTYDPNVSHGLMVWFHDAGRGAKDADDMKAIWQGFCEDYNFIMMGSKSQNNDGWLASETEGVMMDVKAVLGQYTIDRARVLAHGMGVGGQMAFYIGFNARDTFRGVATVGAVLGTSPKDKIPNQPLSFFISGGDKDPLIKEIRDSKTVLEEKKYPIIYREMKDTGKQYFLTDVFEDLQKWMDSLDQI